VNWPYFDEAFTFGRASPLLDPPIQFADFASWERRSIESEFMKGQLAYWREQLSGSLDAIEFKPGIKGSDHSIFRTGSQPFELDGNLFNDLKVIAREEGCTPFMALVTALNILLHVYTGRQDIRIGTMAANRRRHETEGVIGHFTNTVIVRCTFSPQVTFKQLLQQVREVTLAAYAHQEFPFEQLTRVLEQQGNINRVSLFPLMLIYQNPASQLLQLSGLDFAHLDIKQFGTNPELTITACDLIFSLRESSTKLTGALTYKTEIFDSRDITNLVKFLVQILASMIARLEQTLEGFLDDYPANPMRGG
jgi:non-ribosomal peptide synthetase component F